MCKLSFSPLLRILLNIITLLFGLFTSVNAKSLPELQFYETSVPSDFGNGCEFEAIYSMKFKPFKAWRFADNVAYVLWQQTMNGGSTWENINGQSGVNKDELHVMVEGSENLAFRAIVVADATEESAKQNAEYIGENGVPANANVKYTISKTLKSMTAEPSCEFDPDWLCTRQETFGMCGAHSFRHDTAMKVSKYFPGGTEEMTWGQYVLVSNPDSAIYTKECPTCPMQYQFASVKDENGNVIEPSPTSQLLSEYEGDAFALVMMSKEEYKKTNRICNLFSGRQPICPCKSYVLRMYFSSVGSSSGTRIYPKITILDPETGDTLGSQTYFLTFKGYELHKLAIPFMPPVNYKKQGFFAIVELDYESTNENGEKMSDYVTFTVDELAFCVCGVRVPFHNSNVDRKPYRILSNGFFCRMDDGNRVGQWNGLEQWRYKYPDADFIWQRRNSANSPWVTLESEKDTFLTYHWEEGEDKPMYRVLLAESAEVNQQKMENGFPDDPCAIRTEPYALGFFCTEYVCPKTKFSFVKDDEKAKDYDTIVSFKRKEDIKIVLYQNDNETLDAFYAKGCDKPIISESSGKKHTLYLPAVDSTFVIYAMNDTCYTDSVFFTIKKVIPDTKFSFVDGDTTAKKADSTINFNRNEDVKVVIYQNDDEELNGFYIKGSDTPIKSEKSGNKYTLYIPSVDGTAVIYAMNDTVMTDSIYFTISKICPETKLSFVEGDINAVDLDTTVCYNRIEDLKIAVYQNDDENLSGFYIKGSKNNIKCETSGRKHILEIPAKDGSFVIYAKNDTCLTDSVYFTIAKDGKVEFEKIDDSGTREIVVEAKGGTCNYTYDFGEGFQESNVLTDITYGKKYKISVKDEDGCRADTIFQTNKYEVVVTPMVTPNGDGVNDKFEIKGLEKYPNSEITLYDRTGKKLLSTIGEKFEGWDGTYLGHPLPSTDYWYEIFISELDKTYIGHFTLVRE